MRKQYFICIVILSNFIGYAQNLTIDELVDLRKKDLGQVEEYLSTKGWEYLQGDTGGFGELDSATFSYSKSQYNNKAESFITYSYSQLSETKRIQIQIHEVEIYNKYLNRIKSYGCKLIKSTMEDGILIKYYQGKTTTFQILVGTQVDDFEAKHSIYSIRLISNEDYKINFNN